MNQELIKYIETKIFPQYEKNEEGHGIKHIKTVIERSLELAEKYETKKELSYVIAAYHDLGYHIDPKTHEIISAEMFWKDEEMKKYFTEEERKQAKEAIEDHRASSNHEPRSIYGKIVSTADRNKLNIENSIRRSYSYGKKNYLELTEEQQIERVYNYLSEKYGKDGYARVYLEEEEFKKETQELQKQLEDKKEFIKKVNKIIN